MRFAVASLLVLLFAAILLVSCGGGASQVSTPPPPPTPGGGANTLGSASSSPTTCPSSTANPPVAGSCMNLTITCPQVADYSPVLLKVSTPATSSKGTVLFTTGGAGNDFYQDHFQFGSTAVADVVNASFTAVQIAFTAGSTGWLTGPAADGPLTLSCRWATTAQWVHDNVRQPSTAFCATGNSAGAGVIAYALARYGQGSIFDYVVPTGGPPFSRIDEGCICNGTMINTSCVGPVDPCYGLNANMFLDPAYENGHCSNHDTSDVPLWQKDSILSSDGKSVLNYPNTRVHFIFGGLDTTPGIANAALWQQAITSQNDFECVQDAPHEIADALDGAQAVANDLIAQCH